MIGVVEVDSSKLPLACKTGLVVSALIGVVEIGSGEVVLTWRFGVVVSALPGMVETGSGDVVLACRTGVVVSESTVLTCTIGVEVELTNLGQLCGLAIAGDETRRTTGRRLMSCMMARVQR